MPIQNPSSAPSGGFYTPAKNYRREIKIALIGLGLTSAALVGFCNYRRGSQQQPAPITQPALPAQKPEPPKPPADYIETLGKRTVWDAVENAYDFKTKRNTFKTQAAYNTAIIDQLKKVVEQTVKKFPDQKYLEIDRVLLVKCADGTFRYELRGDGIPGDVAYTNTKLVFPGLEGKQAPQTPPVSTKKAVIKKGPCPEAITAQGGCNVRNTPSHFNYSYNFAVSNTGSQDIRNILSAPYRFTPVDTPHYRSAKVSDNAAIKPIISPKAEIMREKKTEQANWSKYDSKGVAELSAKFVVSGMDTEMSVQKSLEQLYGVTQEDWNNAIPGMKKAA